MVFFCCFRLELKANGSQNEWNSKAWDVSNYSIFCLVLVALLNALSMVEFSWQIKNLLMFLTILFFSLSLFSLVDWLRTLLFLNFYVTFLLCFNACVSCVFLSVFVFVFFSFLIRLQLAGGIQLQFISCMLCLFCIDVLFVYGWVNVRAWNCGRKKNLYSSSWMPFTSEQMQIFWDIFGNRDDWLLGGQLCNASYLLLEYRSLFFMVRWLNCSSPELNHISGLNV